MDENAYQQAYAEINAQKCWFEKAILARQAHCSLCQHLLLAEREAVRCTEDQARKQCQAWLKKIGESEQKTHRAAIKWQVGGLQGLYRWLYPQKMIPMPIPDIILLIQQQPASVPYERILPYIHAYEGRRRKSKSTEN